MTADLDRAVAELETWSTRALGPDVRLAEPPRPMLAGMDTEVAAFRLTGPGLEGDWAGPLVLRVHRQPDRADTATREAAVQRWCDRAGYPVARMLMVGLPGDGFTLPSQVMQRVPGVPMLGAITRRPWQARSRLRELAALHARLHRLDPTGFPEQPKGLAASKLALAEGWAETLAAPDLDRAARQVRTFVAELDAGPRAVCHGDFHPLNVVVGSEGAAVLDWTDAGLGDPVGDVARTALLLRVAGVAASSSVERTVLRAVGPGLSRAYLAAYRADASLDDDRFARWTSLHLLHGWAQVRALHAGVVGTDAERARIPTALAPWLAEQFARSVR